MHEEGALLKTEDEDGHVRVFRNSISAAARAAVSVEVARKKRAEARRVDKAVGSEGQFELGSRRVENPYDPGSKINVPANVRADAITRMHTKGELDEAQFLAAQRMRELIEQAGERGAPAVDPTREPVDGSGKPREPVWSQMNACRELAIVRKLLGVFKYRVVRAFVADGLNATLISNANQMDRKHVIGVLRDGLNECAILWLIASGPQHANKRAAIIAFLHETPSWEHEERSLRIEYRKQGA